MKAPPIVRCGALVVAAGLALVACGDSDAPAATVGSIELTDEDVMTEVNDGADLYSANSDVEFYANLAGYVDAENAATDAGRDVLGTQIVFSVAEDLLDELGGEVTEEDREAVLETAPEDLPDLEHPYNQRAIDRQALIEALTRAVAIDEGIELDPMTYYTENAEDLFGEVCVRHFLVDSLEEAEAARSRVVDDGEAFEDVASEVSTDQASAANGGDLGCANPGNYVEEFATAALEQEIDEVGPPVESQFGFHVLVVYGRTLDIPPFSEAEAQVESQIAAAAGTALNERWTTRITEADIRVNLEIGRWDGTTYTVVAP